MSEARLDELESKIAFQEQLIDQLNDIVTRHSLTIDQLEHRCQQLTEHLQTVSEQVTTANPASDIPPHY